ncbi:hypothetical protein [Salinarimonas soli]|uniref:Rap1a immunity protein domain-containing protein n=1 Tax=Salinarimonas soli TaxID=1638099 RepID=A0A5B2VWY9_9HYPH|nr:hypothetical protein [Salinarimonas soli]KAA2244343.1 hypothetical protein F0L46_00140 [Salinarimonas soli]
MPSKPTPKAARRVAAAALTACLALPALPVAAQAQPAARERTWSEEKCARYTKGWSDLVARRGKAGLGPAFIERHEAFLASGCLAQADVCPRSPEELDVANILTILAMNAGTASTFLPFACRR